MFPLEVSHSVRIFIWICMSFFLMSVGSVLMYRFSSLVLISHTVSIFIHVFLQVYVNCVNIFKYLYRLAECYWLLQIHLIFHQISNTHFPLPKISASLLLLGGHATKKKPAVLELMSLALAGQYPLHSHGALAPSYPDHCGALHLEGDSVHHSDWYQ
jgi:hypothetical protein